MSRQLLFRRSQFQKSFLTLCALVFSIFITQSISAQTYGHTVVSATSVQFYANDASWADAHYTLNGGPQQNVRLINSGKNNSLTVDVPVNASIRYFLTTFNGNILSTPWVTFTVTKGGGCTSSAATIYRDCNHSGTSIGLAVGRYTLSKLLALGVKNDDVSSLRVSTGYKITFYEHDNFSGTAVAKSGDDTCLLDDSFNDAASSIVVELNGNASFSSSSTFNASSLTSSSSVSTFSSSSVAIGTSSLGTSSSLNSSAMSSMSSHSSSVTFPVPVDLPEGTVDVLPVLNITTTGSAPIVSKDDYLSGNFSLDVAGAASVQGVLEIRGRGNSSWDWPKKPYRLKLANSTELLGMPAGKHWVLLANYVDKTMMRNDIAFMLSRHAGMEYTVRSQYVELNINGAYQGVYQLAEHIRIAKDRVNVPELKAGDTALDKISGGYLFEFDFRRGEAFCISSLHGMSPLCVSSPETLLEATWSAQRSYIQTYFTSTETAIFATNFADTENGYAKYIDVDSAINYYLINELFKNVDGAVTSAYLYKKRDGKLFFGPIWDFDLSMGNAGYSDVEKTYGCHIRRAAWFGRLFEDPAFRTKVRARWQVLKDDGTLDYILQYAQARATWLETQQIKNYRKWSITDVASWVNHVSRGTYDLEVKELIRWQKARTQWMDRYISDPAMSCNIN